MRVIIRAKKESYSIDDLNHSMTIRELIDFLSQYDDETKVFISNDGGYTFGSITKFDIKRR